MYTKHNWIQRLAPSVALILLLITLSACTSSTETSQGAVSASGTSQPSSPAASTSIPNDATKHPLANASPNEIGRLALQAATRWEMPGTAAQVVLAHHITMDEVSRLGLGCYNFASMETPPLMLVILKGDFNIKGMMPGMDAPGVVDDEHVAYIAYVYDLWAGQPAIVVTSRKAGSLRKALNDPTLPSDSLTGVSDAQPACPTGTTSTKTQHYGDVAPPAATPTPNQ